jgi:hypothetical protein
MALSADRNRKRRGNGIIFSLPVAQNANIFKGAIVAINTGGYAAPGANTSGFLTAGVAEEHVHNTGADGAVRIRVMADCEFLFTASSIVQAAAGAVMMCVDDDTVDETGSNNVKVGRLTEYVSATQGWVYVPGLTAFV